MISRVKHVVIPVKDQDKSLEFYTKKLGFVLVMDAEFELGEQRWIELKIPNGETQVVLFTPQGHEDRIGTFSNIVFTTDDVAKTVIDLKKKGVIFSQDVTEEPWGIYAVLEDPDGNAFCTSSS